MSDLERILESEPSIEPSSGFVGAVMGAVRAAAVEPSPLPFPWRRLALGWFVCAALIVVTVVLLLRAPAAAPAVPDTAAASAAWRSVELPIVCAVCGLLWTFGMLRITRLLVRF